MTIKPIENITAPNYPDKYNEEIRRVLASAKPNRWIGAPFATGMLAATVALSLSGCVSVPPGTRISGTAPSEPVETSGRPAPPETAPTDERTPDISEYVTMGEPVPFPTNQYSLLIPLFEYGEGTGSIGCVSIAAPVFLSEEEAFAIISAAFADVGMKLNRGGETLEMINIPVTNLFEFEKKADRYATVQGNMEPDGTLADLWLPVAFVSTKDVSSWHEDTGMMASVVSYDAKKTAQTLAESNPGLVVFYDPIAGLDYDKLWGLKQEDGESDQSYHARRSEMEQEASQAARAESERLLRMQAEAFIAWLEYEG